MKKYFLSGLVITLLIFSCDRKGPNRTLILDQKNEIELIWEALPDTLLPPDTTKLKSKDQAFIGTVSPQTLPLDHPYGLQIPPAINYALKEGLDITYINSLTVDDSGNLWIAGLGGLSKFDGTTFTNYSNRNGVRDIFGNVLQIDPEGNIIIDSGNELSKFDGQKFTPIPFGGGDANFINSMVQSPDGDIWVSTNKGLYRIQKDSSTRYYDKDGLEGFRGKIFLNSKTGDLLAVTEGGIKKFQDDMFIPYYSGDQDGLRFNNAYSTRNGDLWFNASKNGKSFIGRFDGVNTTKLIDQKFSFTRYFFEDGLGSLWILTNEELLNYNDDRLTQYSYEELGLKGNFANSMTDDSEGNLWIGTEDGISFLNRRLFGVLEIPNATDEKEATSSISNLGIDRFGRKWAFSGYNLLHIKKDSVEIYDLSRFTKDRFSPFIDQGGSAYFTTLERKTGLSYLVKVEEGKVYQYDLGSIERFGEISQDQEGNIFLTDNNGFKILKDDLLLIYGPEQGVPERISAHLEDSKGRKWLSFNDAGIRILKGDSILKLDKNTGLQANFVNAITEDPQGNIWIGTDGGLSKFDSNSLLNYGPAEGLGNIVTEIKYDSISNRIWFFNSNGLASIPLDSVGLDNPKFQLYSPKNGYDLIPSAFFLGQTMEFDSTGIWLESTSGFIRFETSQIKSPEAPKLTLNEIRVDNRPILWSLLEGNKESQVDSLMFVNESVLKFGREIHSRLTRSILGNFDQIEFDGLHLGGFIPKDLKLPFANNSISFSFSTSSLEFGKNIQYRYQLADVFRDWTRYSEKGEANLVNLREGNYTLQIEALSPLGTTSSLTYTFEVLPPWYRTWWAYCLYLVSFIVLIYLIIRGRTRALKREKETLENQVSIRTKELNQSLENLKSTQAQLIQSEKMASLGELTAGIAHEIQNPLNFVNNFSEVSEELVDEMNEELEKGDTEEAKFIAADLKENLSKINHHGKRADTIVKGMLEHSRVNKGEKAPTDLNALADEFVRLSYHGLRAKDKSFTADFKLDLDPELPKVTIVAPDIGRVILNLVNNAFYAVNEKAKLGIEDFRPEVIVSTNKTENGIELSVQDNGPGIPHSIKEKIFQPFFTTKPTGSGTGLGLSLSYDIVKANGGKLSLKNHEEAGAIFSIFLPVIGK